MKTTTLLLIAICSLAFVSTTYGQNASPLLNLENNIISTGMASVDQSVELFRLKSTNATAVAVAWSNLKTNIASLSANQLFGATIGFQNSVNNGLIDKQEYYTSLRDGISQRIMSGILYIPGSSMVNDYSYISNISYQKERPEVFRKAYALTMDFAFTNEYVYVARWLFATASGQEEDTIIKHALDVAKTTITMSTWDAALRCINDIAYHKAIKIARAAGKPTVGVGVVVDEYKNLIDAQKTGVGFVEALKVFGWDWPGNWSNEVAQADQIVQDVYSGEIFRPTPAQLVKIRLYKGTDFLTEFVEKFNKL